MTRRTFIMMRAAALGVLAVMILAGLARPGRAEVPPAGIFADDPPPPPPEEKDWRFVKELQEPYHQPVRWTPREATDGEVDLSAGFTVEKHFPDPRGRLETAYQDLDDFRGAIGLGQGGPFKIITEKIDTKIPETYCLRVSDGECRIQAGDSEGIRRGIFQVEDRIYAAQGPFLKAGADTRTPVIRSRISRCFFGPIKRPPKNRDELNDDVNYYPEQYLNRLAHEGINGLWLTITFEDLCKTQAVPEYGKGAERRLAKLRDTVRRCLRYGIKTYVFCIEPAAFTAGSPVLAAHPELGGHRAGGTVFFCPSGKAGQEYLKQATYSIFSAVPDLGGLIDISVGERNTICPNAGMAHNNCPRCSKRKAWEIMADCLAAMERGMHAANPNAELISWFYIPSPGGWTEEDILETAGHIPPGVALQHNFESKGGELQLGHWRNAYDYWLSYAGPSQPFADYARRAVPNGTRMFAKLQVGCSHELATVPFIPVPGKLYEKYRAMHELGVSGAMQCWYFGNYPGLMNRAAGELAFAPLPVSQDRFLIELARRDWGEDAERVAQAWKYFAEGYGNYPLNTIFSYCGPMATGVVWPLYLKPCNLPLEPSWQLLYPPSGDRIGECVTQSHTLEEDIILSRRMAGGWAEGVKIMSALRTKYAGNPERLKDIGLAEALGIQLESGANILEFYGLRERLAWSRGGDRLGMLERMRALVKNELALDVRLLPLAEADSRLGFHSEAEGYKYYPGKIQWRMKQLEKVLATDFPAIERRIGQGQTPFPEYIGEGTLAHVYECPKAERPIALDGKCDEGAWAALPGQAMDKPGNAARKNGRQTFWRAAYDADALNLGVVCREAKAGAGRPAAWGGESIEIQLEPKRLWPAGHFRVGANGAQSYRIVGGVKAMEWQAAVHQEKDTWCVQVRIPWTSLELDPAHLRPIRLNVIHDCAKDGSKAWLERHLVKMAYPYAGENNPNDMGWLRFGGGMAKTGE